jgi:hypothetical protein
MADSQFPVASSPVSSNSDMDEVLSQIPVNILSQLSPSSLKISESVGDDLSLSIEDCETENPNIKRKIELCTTLEKTTLKK